MNIDLVSGTSTAAGCSGIRCHASLAAQRRLKAAVVSQQLSRIAGCVFDLCPDRCHLGRERSLARPAFLERSQLRRDLFVMSAELGLAGRLFTTPGSFPLQDPKFSFD